MLGPIWTVSAGASLPSGDVDDFADVDPVAGVFAVRRVLRWRLLRCSPGAESEGLGVAVSTAGWGKLSAHLTGQRGQRAQKVLGECVVRFDIISAIGARDALRD
jgi:hypothetical protein